MTSKKELRFRLAKSELNLLETIYQETSRPSLKLRKELANRIGVEQRKLQVWFQNRRAKDGKLDLPQSSKEKEADFVIDLINQDSSRSSPSSGSNELDIKFHCENPNAKSVFSHYWASTMNTCKMLSF
ncbi:hypothetical protein K502DRAFT_324024 [Neoconidiobolus thromboides FSU 785]|nr:hypothetical protein K502DRAFT_324024 [Neoconidiobolus thromboides FSU 785]